MLNWLRPFSIFCLLDNQQYNNSPHGAECLVAAGAVEFIEGDDIKDADAFLKKGEWCFGHLSYELQHLAHNISRSKKDAIGFPLFYFFRPQIVLEIMGDELHIYADDADKIWTEINAVEVVESDEITASIQPQPLLSKDEYIRRVKVLQEHIHRGDCYEINFCQAFAATNAHLDPFCSFQNLMAISPNPFSAFYRLDDRYLLCASPERFLTKKEGKIFSQPIKGTIKRSVLPAEDEGLKKALRNNAKEQAENVMVVDLVRNDLTQVCKDATVKVEELFGIYSFPQVHQMISTISGELREDISFSQIIAATFPMGSMTGAPKHRVMQLIDEYEPTARRIFSGSVGYFHPSGDFDFNVVIRSIMYNSTNQNLSYQVGSAITFYSDAEKEWEECTLKAEAIRKVL